jgi:hypothetical protein
MPRLKPKATRRTTYGHRANLSKQEPIEVSRGLVVEAKSGGHCARCQEPYGAGETVALMVPPPGAQRPWDTVCAACTPKLPKPRRWSFKPDLT